MEDGPYFKASKEAMVAMFAGSLMNCLEREKAQIDWFENLSSLGDFFLFLAAF